MCVCGCVCVCVSGPLLRRGMGSRNQQQHAFVLFRAFVSRGGPRKQNTRASFIRAFASKGGGPRKQNTRASFIRATASGRGVAKAETRAAFVRASVAQGGGALNTCINTWHKGFIIVVRACSRKYINCSMHAHLTTMEFIKGRRA